MALAAAVSRPPALFHIGWTDTCAAICSITDWPRLHRVYFVCLRVCVRVTMKYWFAQ